MLYNVRVGDRVEILISLFCFCGPTIEDSAVKIMDFDVVREGEISEIHKADDCNQLIPNCPTYQNRTVRVYTYDGVNSRNIRLIGEALTDEAGVATFPYLLIDSDLEEYESIRDKGSVFCLAVEVESTLDQHIECGFTVSPKSESLAAVLLDTECTTTKAVIIGAGAWVLYSMLKR